jgi:two-component system LytT family response regulator
MNAIIVDDENKACMNLARMLETYGDYHLHISGIANSTTEALLLIEANKPDVVFLDIEMPDENAFEFLTRISPVNFEIIFVTAYDEFAIKALRLNAVDYILKPIRINDLKNAIVRLNERFQYRKMLARHNDAYVDLSRQMISKEEQLSITLKDLESIEIIKFKNLFYVEAHGAYSKFVFLKDGKMKEMLSSYALAYYDEILPTNIFFRIHRSYILNCNHIVKLLTDSCNVIVTGETVLPISRRRFSILLDFLKNIKL